MVEEKADWYHSLSGKLRMYKALVQISMYCSCRMANGSRLFHQQRDGF